MMQPFQLLYELALHPLVVVVVVVVELVVVLIFLNFRP
jgi:hypothetical protein